MDKANVPVRETEVSRVMGNLSKAVECLTQSIDATELIYEKNRGKI